MNNIQRKMYLRKTVEWYTYKYGSTYSGYHKGLIEVFHGDCVLISGKWYWFPSMMGIKILEETK